MEGNSAQQGGARKAAPILTRANYRQWFQIMQNYLEGENVFWAIEDMPLLQGTTPSSTPSSSATINSLQYSIHSPEWKKANGKARFNIYICLSEDDQDEIEEVPKACDVWVLLKSKYSKAFKADAMGLVQEYVNFKMSEEDSIRKAWLHLQNLGRKIAEIDPSQSIYKNPETRIKHLLAALPETYRSTRLAINAQPSLNSENILLLLENQEAEFKLLDSDTAMLAKRGYRDSGSMTCNLCDTKGHWQKDCPGLKAAKQAAKAKVGGRVEKRRTSPPRPTRKTSPSRSGSALSTSGLRKLINELILEQTKPKQKHRAHQADEGSRPTSASSSEPSGPSGDEETESASPAAVDARGKLPSTQWLLDSGASTHMTDNRALFRGPLTRIDRRWIKVGGGYLYSEHVGRALVQDQKGNQIVLKSLLVPKLGVNLISTRKLCADYSLAGVQYKGWFSFIDQKDSKRIIDGKEHQGVIILETIHRQPMKDQAHSQLSLANEAIETGLCAAMSNPMAEHIAIPGITAERHAMPSLTRHYSRNIPSTLLRNIPSSHPDSMQTEEALEAMETSDNAMDVSQPDLPDKKKQEYILWHRRFAHLGAETLRKLHKVTTLDKPIPIAPNHQCPCEVCALTKMRHFKGKQTDRKERVLALVSIDIEGPKERSMDGHRYVLHIVDNYSRKAWVYPLQARDDAPIFLQPWKKKVELETGLKLQAVRSDNAPELVKLVKQWEKEFGVVHNDTVAYIHNQNGVAERNIQTSEANVRAMLKDSGLPNEFWPEAAQADVYLRNRTAIGPEVDGRAMSPEEAYTGKIPSIDHVRTWGCKVYSYMSPQSLPDRADKLMDRGRVGVFLGYVEETDKQYYIWAPDKRAKIKTSDVRFSEWEKGGDIDLKIKIESTPNTAPDRKPRGRPKKDSNEVQRRVLSHVEIPVNRPTGHYQKEEEMDVPPSPNQPLHKEAPTKLTALNKTAPIDKTPPNKEAPTQNGTPRQEEPAAPANEEPPNQGRKRRRNSDSEDSEERQGKILRAFTACQEVIEVEEGEDFEPIDWAMAAAHGVIEEVPIPETYQEAVNHPEWGQMWKEAVAREIQALTANSTWEEVKPPKGSNIVTSKWVFTVKRNTDGSIEKFKARLVARGFSQKFGIDYEDTFAPTVRHDTLRAFMAVVCMEDLECHQVDVNNAFTESILKETIYMKPPPGVDIPPGQCFRILRSLYGLKQAARDWNQYCVKELKKLGFIQSEADPCLLTLPSKKLIILVYVDDVTIAAPELSSIQWFKEEFGKVFKIKDLGEIQKILGVKVTRDRAKGTLRLDQTHYAKDVLAKLHMNTDRVYPTASPLSSYDALRPANINDERADREAYQKGVGHWMYLGILTRPDISFALGRLSQYLADPAKFHMSALKTMSRYIRSSQDLGILYSKRGNKHLEGYSDSDYAMDKIDRVSILGNVFFLAGGPISWSSKKQKSVATSTMQAEYMAMCSCAKQSQWIAQILRDMGMHHFIGPNPYQPAIKEDMKHLLGSPAAPISLKGDNQAALLLVKDAHTHERSKHIDIAYHYVRLLWQMGRIVVDFIGTADMVADGLTKPKNGPQFKRFVNQLGLVEED